MRVNPHIRRVTYTKDTLDHIITVLLVFGRIPHGFVVHQEMSVAEGLAGSAAPKVAW